MKKEDIYFMSELGVATKLQPRMASNLLLSAIVVFFVGMIMWAAFTQVEERTQGIGKVMPSSDMQVIQSLEGGIVSELLVSEGDLVKAGQILLRIDDVFFASEERGIEAQMRSLQAQQARLKAEVLKAELVMPAKLKKSIPVIAQNEMSLFKTRKQELTAALSVLENEIKEAQSNLGEIKASIRKFAKAQQLTQKELDITLKLVARRAAPEINKIRLEKALNETVGNLATAKEALKAMQARLSATKQRLKERQSAFKSKALGELNQVETQISAIQESLASAGDRVRRAELRSPVDGIVQRLAVKTIGGVIEPAQRLVEIVPIEDDLMIRAKVSPSDVAFLRPNLDVRVSITAYDAQIYGSLLGRLERISADAVQDGNGNMYFEIDVRTEKSYLGTETEPFPITPGMVAETEVITGKRSILTYLLKPIRRAKHKAFTER